jgi:hypothetical protein
MRRALLIVLVVVAAGFLGWFAVSQRHTGRQSDGLVVARPTVRDSEPVLQTTHVPHAGPVTAQAALDALLATAREPGGALPPGTRLLSVAVDGKLATLDLSKEFRALDTMGDASESLAQNALRKALAQVPDVDQMTVKVQGVVYSGEHSGDWAGIPVRDAGAAESGAQ